MVANGLARNWMHSMDCLACFQHLMLRTSTRSCCKALSPTLEKPAGSKKPKGSMAPTLRLRLSKSKMWTGKLNIYDIPRSYYSRMIYCINLHLSDTSVLSIWRYLSTLKLSIYDIHNLYAIHISYIHIHIYVHQYTWFEVKKLRFEMDFSSSHWTLTDGRTCLEGSKGGGFGGSSSASARRGDAV